MRTTSANLLGINVHRSSERNFKAVSLRSRDSRMLGPQVLTKFGKTNGRSVFWKSKPTKLCLTNIQSTRISSHNSPKMKYIHSQESLTVPEGVKVHIKTRIVTVEGPKGAH
jgi:hypothetical protein